MQFLMNFFKNGNGSRLFYFLFFSLAHTACHNEKIAHKPVEIHKKPNIIVILTDQERYPIHWPEGFAEKNLSSSLRLKKHGLTFHRAYTSACECSPSRAVIESGEHYPTNKVYRTPPPQAGLPSEKELMDIGSLLKEKAGYDVVWKGKWHLSWAVDKGYNWSEKDIAHMQKQYALSGWNPPDAGNAIMVEEPTAQGTMFQGLTSLGGGYANNDGRYVQGITKDDLKQTPGFGESILDYLAKLGMVAPAERKPFCLFISLVNPHDVWVYPNSWKEAGYQQEEFTHLGIGLPANYADDLTTKPSIQLKAREAYNKQATLKDKDAEIEYVNFYAYLHKCVDAHLNTILDALEINGLLDSTIIIRTADHGELGLSHGMREKAYTAYEEMIHIPLIISNPKMYPLPKTTESLYCHIDLMPTLAELAGIPNPSSYGKGVSIVPILKDASVSVQDSILFTYDDLFFLPTTTPGSHIRAVREGDWTYAVYYSETGGDFEYELYNLKNDPGQLVNLLHGAVSRENAQEAKRLHVLLKAKIDKANALPKGVLWPEMP